LLEDKSQFLSRSFDRGGDKEGEVKTECDNVLVEDPLKLSLVDTMGYDSTNCNHNIETDKVERDKKNSVQKQKHEATL
jgi:hypothetical protein